MKEFKFAVAVLAAIGRLMAVEIGDTRDSVLAEKGQPIGDITGAGAELLRYKDATIKLRDGRVVAVERPPPQVIAAPRPAAPSPTPGNPPVVPDAIAEPKFPKRFVGGPEFHTVAGVRAAGTAFFARIPDDPQVYVLTVHHLLGPMGGFAKLIAHEDVPSFVQGIQLNELFGQSAWHPVTGCVVPVGDDPRGPLHELAVFKTTGVDADDAAVLATGTPAPGQQVWVIAHVLGGVPDGELIHGARVVGLQGQWLVCVFDNPKIITNGASGAPLVNAGGQVVGIYQGHSDQNGLKYAFVIPSTLIIQTLRQF